VVKVCLERVLVFGFKQALSLTDELMDGEASVASEAVSHLKAVEFL
jgi:hypothetical protein